MKTKRKALTLALCAVLLVVTSVLGTLAYLTDHESVVNTFTVGQVHIGLDEAKVKADGTYVTNHDNRTTDPVSADEKEGNEYHLIPGHTYFKDPTVTVVEGSEDCYVRMIVTVTDLADAKTAFGADATTGYLLLQNFVDGWDSATWITKGVVENNDNTATYEFWYKEVVKKDDTKNTVLDDLFDSFTVPGEGVTNEDLALLDEFTISIEAHAIQADGFANADAAWTAFHK